MSRRRLIFIYGLIFYIFITLNYPILEIVIKQAKAENSIFNEQKCEDLLLPHTINTHNWDVKSIKSLSYVKLPKPTQKNFIITYIVKPRDTLWKISQKYGVKPVTIRKLNNLKGNTLKIGMKLKIATKKGFFHKVKRGETLNSICAKYNISINDVRKANSLTSDYLIAGKRLFLPGVIIKSG
jgi:LysM repeat protein